VATLRVEVVRTIRLLPFIEGAIEVILWKATEVSDDWVLGRAWGIYESLGRT
jgi:hypothetical protein